MRYGTSFYNLTLGRQLTARFWPLGAAYTLLLAILMPVRALIVQPPSYAFQQAYYTLSWARTFFFVFVPWGTMVAGIIAAMVVCSHLYTTRSANFTAALPPRRTALFLTHYLTGLLWLVIPLLVTGLLSTAAYLAKLPDDGAQVWQTLGLGLGASVVALVLYYSLAVLCGMLTGHLLALPIFALVLNDLVLGVWYLLTRVFTTFYYGFPGSSSDIPAWVMWLTPALRLQETAVSISGGKSDPVGLAVYGVVGVLAALGAWGLYVKRPMERAGDVVAWAGLRPVFRYGVAVCSGLALGTLTHMVLTLEQLGLALSILLWGVAGCFVAQMLLTKSVRVLRYWKGAVAVALTLGALILVMVLDLTGYETRVPDANRVTSVEVSGLYSSPGDNAAVLDRARSTDPQTIQLAVQLHQALVEHRYNPTDHSDLSQIWVTYTLSNGTHLSRYYYLPLLPRQVDQAGTTTQLATALINRPDLLESAYGLDEIPALEAKGYRLTSGTAEGVGGSHIGLVQSFSGSDARAVYQALLLDLQEGNVERSLIEDNGEVYLQLIWDPFAVTDPIQGRYASSAPSHLLSICVTDRAVHTLAALEELGY